MHESNKNSENFSKLSSAVVKNNSGSVREAAAKTFGLRNGEVVEFSELWHNLLKSAKKDEKGEETNKQHMVQCMSFDKNGWVSWFLNTKKVVHVSTMFEKLDNGDYKTELAFAHDEICRMIVKGFPCMITMLTRKTDSITGNAVIENHSWMVVNKNILLGLSSDELIDSFSYSSTTNDDVNFLEGYLFCSSENIEFW